MKLFTTKIIETVKYCQEYFDFSLPSYYGPSFKRFCVCAIVKL